MFYLSIKQILSVSPSERTRSNVTSTSAEYAPQTFSNIKPRPPSQSKTSYQFGHPALHVRHKMLRLRPKVLLQLQQMSKTARSLPILDILPSSVFIPPLARRFPQVFRFWNGLGPDDLVIMRSEVWERTVPKICEKDISLADKDRGLREVIATIREPIQKEARSQGKANIVFKSGSLCEATPLPGGSYEFLFHTKNGVQAMRWALRSNKKRSSPTSSILQSQDDFKRFTFSIINPTSSRNSVVASITRYRLEVYEKYALEHRSCIGPMTSNSAAPIFGDEYSMEGAAIDAIGFEECLQLLVVVTGIWVAFREGWSRDFRYRDPVAVSNAKADP